MLVLRMCLTLLLPGTCHSPSHPPSQPLPPNPNACFAPLTCLCSLCRLNWVRGLSSSLNIWRPSLALAWEGRVEEGGQGERVNEKWVTQLLSEAENSLWPKPWVLFPPHQLGGPWRTISLGFSFDCQSPMAPRDQFVECKFPINWLEQEQE